MRTISSSGITCAGEKKWAPTMRSAARVSLPIRLMSMVLVLLLRMASGRHAFSRSAKIFCFNGMFCDAVLVSQKLEITQVCV